MAFHCSQVKLCVSAPGKVILHGEHSVVYGHLAIAASLDLRSKLEFEEVGVSALDGDSSFILPDIDLKITLPTSTLTNNVLSLTASGIWDGNHPDKVNFEKVVQGVQRFIDCEPSLQDLKSAQRQALTSCLFLMAAILHEPGQTKPVPLKPFIIRASSDLPVGAGAGSSASYCVCLAALFLALANKFKDTKNQFHLDDETKNLVSSWAFLGERIMHGNPSGLDNSICTFGSVIAFRRPNTILKVQLNRSLRVLLVDTKVSRNTRSLVERVAKLREHHRDAVNNILEAMNCVSLEAVELLREMDEPNGKTSKPEKDQSFSRMEELWSMNHSLLVALGVSHPSLERIIQIAKQHNLSGKLTGAGGGGFAILLAPSSNGCDSSLQSVDSNVTALKKLLATEGFEVKDVKLGGQGVELFEIQ